MFWNCTGIRSNISELKLFIYTKKPQLIGLCETFLTSKYSCNFVGYRIIRKDREGNVGRGGLAFLIRSDLCYANANLQNLHNSIVENLSIKIKFDFGWAYCGIFYNPPSNDLTPTEIAHYLDQFPRNSLIAGDFNSHHPLWAIPGRSRLSNPSGITIFDYLSASYSLSLLTPTGLPTYFHNTSGKYSTLDLTFGSGHFAYVSSISTGPGIGGNHFPVIHKFDFKPSSQLTTGRPKWQLKEMNWETWKENVSANLPTTKDISSLPMFTKCLIDAGKAVTKLSDTKRPSKYNKSWWNIECSKKVALRRRSQRLYARNPTIERKVALNRDTACATRIIKESKRTSWNRLTSSLTPDTPSGIIWRFLGNIQGKEPPHAFPIHHHATPLATHKEKANAFADHFVASFNHHHNHDHLVPEITTHIAFEAPGPYNTLLTMEELCNSLYNLKKQSAMGPDQIPNQFLINLPPDAKENLLEIFNDSWMKGILPATWKYATILPFLKPNKDPASTSSYRPISLLSCVGKLMESIVNRRLYWHLENKNLLPKKQFGFRKRNSTLDPLLLLEKDIQVTLRTQKILFAIFFDIEKAFYHVSRTAILIKLKNLNIRGKLFNWIYDFLNERSFEVSVGSALSQPYTTSSGVPQGAILSPILYTLMLIDLNLPQAMKSLYYADDTTFYTIGDDLNKITVTMQNALNVFSTWCNEWGLQVNPQKLHSCASPERE